MAQPLDLSSLSSRARSNLVLNSKVRNNRIHGCKIHGCSIKFNQFRGRDNQVRLNRDKSVPLSVNSRSVSPVRRVLLSRKAMLEPWVARTTPYLCRG